jgi:hypothetical protein
MSAPALTQYVQGQGSVSADNLNTFQQTCDNFAQLRAFTGASGMQVYARGQATAGDGLFGTFYWNATSAATDDNLTAIVPTSSVGTGAWLRLDTFDLTFRTYQYATPVTGSTVTFNPFTGVLSLNPAGTLAALTIVFPSAPFDGEPLIIATTQTITALTITSAKALATTPTTLAAGGKINLRYDAAAALWLLA